jgi:hypothetical protein
VLGRLQSCREVFQLGLVFMLLGMIAAPDDGSAARRLTGMRAVGRLFGLRSDEEWNTRVSEFGQMPAPVGDLAELDAIRRFQTMRRRVAEFPLQPDFVRDPTSLLDWAERLH